MTSVFFFVFFCTMACTAQLYPNRTDPTATGYRAFIEEFRHDLQHPDYYPSQQHGDMFHDLLAEHAAAQYSSRTDCVQSLPQGLVEFTDFGPMNNLPFKTSDLFVVSPGHTHITGVSHFAFLDAYGARLKDNKLEVVVDSDVSGASGFLTKSGEHVDTLLMHYEAAAMGYGRGDSQALSSPLRVRAVSRAEVAQEVFSLDKEGSGCYCDLYVTDKVFYTLGLLYYPQYGHTLFNGLSNAVATLWRKNIPYSDVVFGINLYRNTSTLVSGVPSTTYVLLWTDMFDDIFRAFSNEVTLWINLLDYAELHGKSICFKRILVGALPHLDLMNISAPQELYNRYSREIIANMYWQELKTLPTVLHVSAPSEVTSKQLNDLMPDQYPDYFSPLTNILYDNSSPSSWKKSTVSPFCCAVTIVTRDVHNARSIVNAQELISSAIQLGCQAQIISMERLSMKDQIGQVRWNSTLFVSVDGSALFNSLFMQKCSTVLYVEMWRRAMMYPKFEPAVWTGYVPVAADTVLDTRHPIAAFLQELITSYTKEGRELELESLSLASLPFPNRDVEDFLRNIQSVRLPLAVFERVLADSIRHNKRCRQVESSSKSTRMVFRMPAASSTQQ